MRIAILGNGSVGQTLSTLLASKGITVSIGARSHAGKSYVDGVQATSMKQPAMLPISSRVQCPGA